MNIFNKIKGRLAKIKHSINVMLAKRMLVIPFIPNLKVIGIALNNVDRNLYLIAKEDNNINGISYLTVYNILGEEVMINDYTKMITFDNFK